MSRKNDKGYEEWKKPDQYCGGGRFRIENSRAVRRTGRVADQENREMDRKTGGLKVVPLPDAETAGAYEMRSGEYRGLTLAEIGSGAPGRNPDLGYIQFVAAKRIRCEVDAVRAACGFVAAQGGPASPGPEAEAPVAMPPTRPKAVPRVKATPV